MDYFDDAYFGDYFETDQTPAGHAPRGGGGFVVLPSIIPTPDPDADEAYLLAGVL